MPARRIRADSHDLAGDLMADHPGQGNVSVAVVIHLDIGAARAAGNDPQHQVPWAGLGIGQRFEPEVLGRIEAGGSRSCGD